MKLMSMCCVAIGALGSSVAFVSAASGHVGQSYIEMTPSSDLSVSASALDGLPDTGGGGGHARDLRKANDKLNGNIAMIDGGTHAGGSGDQVQNDATTTGADTSQVGSDDGDDSQRGHVDKAGDTSS